MLSTPTIRRVWCDSDSRGGTGRLGMVIVESLTQGDTAVRVLTRDRSRATHLPSNGAENRKHYPRLPQTSLMEVIEAGRRPTSA